jgi:hypothetical protein
MFAGVGIPPVSAAGYVVIFFLVELKIDSKHSIFLFCSFYLLALFLNDCSHSCCT